MRTEYSLMLTMKFNNEVDRTDWATRLKAAVETERLKSAPDFISAVMMTNEAQYPEKESEALPGGTGINAVSL